MHNNSRSKYILKRLLVSISFGAWRASITIKFLLRNSFLVGNISGLQKRNFFP